MYTAYHVHAVCTYRIEENLKFLETGVRDSSKLPYGAGS